MGFDFQTFWCFLQAIITEGALHVLIETYCREAGVRNLQKQIEKIYRKVCVERSWTLFYECMCFLWFRLTFFDIWECKSGLCVLLLSTWLFLIAFDFCNVKNVFTYDFQPIVLRFPFENAGWSLLIVMWIDDALFQLVCFSYFRQWIVYSRSISSNSLHIFKVLILCKIVFSLHNITDMYIHTLTHVSTY